MTQPKALPRPVRSMQIIARVTPETYADVEAYAHEHGYTLSTAINCILLEWRKREEAAHAEGL